jgi:hypothetical protein
MIRKLITDSFTTVSCPYFQLLCSYSGTTCIKVNSDVRSSSLCRKIKLRYDPY